VVSLFKPNKAPDEKFPYGGRYFIEKLELLGSHDRMKMVQDGYRVAVKASIDGGRGKTFEEEISEELIVSRFTGGIK